MADESDGQLLAELIARTKVLELAVRHLLLAASLRDDLLIDRYMAAAHAEADQIAEEATADPSPYARQRKLEFAQIMRKHISLSVD